MTSDPIRLLDDPSAAAALRDDLGHATEATVQGLDRAAGQSALQAAMASAARPARTSLVLKVGGAAVVVGVLLWLLAGDGEADRAAALEPEEVAAEQAARPFGSAGAGGAGARAGEASAEPSAADPRSSATSNRASAPAVPSIATPATPEPPSDADPDADPSAGSTPDPAAIDDVTPGSSPAPGRSPKAGKLASRPTAAGPSDATDEAESNLAEEMLEEAELVARARAQLERDPGQALALAEEAERVFPRGHLIEERRAIAIRALVALDRIDEARRRADAFLATFSRGAHAAAVRRALAESAPEPSD